MRSSLGNLVLRVKYQVSNGQVKFVVMDVEAFLKNYFGCRPKLDTQLLLSSLGMALEEDNVLLISDAGLKSLFSAMIGKQL